MLITITQAHAGVAMSRYKGQTVDLPKDEAQKLVDIGWANVAVSPVAVALQTLMSYRIGITYPVAGGDDVKEVVAMAEEMGVDAVPSGAPKPKPAKKPASKKSDE